MLKPAGTFAFAPNVLIQSSQSEQVLAVWKKEDAGA
jgi:hypothetical protein